MLGVVERGAGYPKKKIKTEKFKLKIIFKIRQTTILATNQPSQPFLGHHRWFHYFFYTVLF